MSSAGVWSLPMPPPPGRFTGEASVPRQRGAQPGRAGRLELQADPDGDPVVGVDLGELRLEGPVAVAGPGGRAPMRRPRRRGRTRARAELSLVVTSHSRRQLPARRPARRPLQQGAAGADEVQTRQCSRQVFELVAVHDVGEQPRALAVALGDQAGQPDPRSISSPRRAKGLPGHVPCLQQAPRPTCGPRARTAVHGSASAPLGASPPPMSQNGPVSPSSAKTAVASAGVRRRWSSCSRSLVPDRAQPPHGGQVDHGPHRLTGRGRPRRHVPGGGGPGGWSSRSDHVVPPAGGRDQEVATYGSGGVAPAGRPAGRSGRPQPRQRWWPPAPAGRAAAMIPKESPGAAAPHHFCSSEATTEVHWRGRRDGPCGPRPGRRPVTSACSSCSRPQPASTSSTAEPAGAVAASAAVGGRPARRTPGSDLPQPPQARWVSSASTVAPPRCRCRDEVVRAMEDTGARAHRAEGGYGGRRPLEPAPDNAGGGRRSTRWHPPARRRRRGGRGRGHRPRHRLAGGHRRHDRHRGRRGPGSGRPGPPPGSWPRSPRSTTASGRCSTSTWPRPAAGRASPPRSRRRAAGRPATASVAPWPWPATPTTTRPEELYRFQLRCGLEVERLRSRECRQLEPACTRASAAACWPP